MPYRTGLKESVQSQVRSQYKALLRDISAEDVLGRYGADNVRKSGDEHIHSCIIDHVIPHHSHGDASASASLNGKKGVYHCYSFGGGDLFWLFETMEGSKEKAYAVLSELASGTSYESRDVLKELEELLVSRQESLEIPTYSSAVLRPWMMHHPYITDIRGISEEVAEKHSVGYDPDAVMVVLPHFWNGKLVGWQKRRMDNPKWPQTPLRSDGKMWPKYINTPNFPKSQTLYLGEGGDNEGILLVESVMSVLKLETDREFYKQNLPSVLASTFGAKVGGEQIDWIRSQGFKNVYLWYDSDLPGRSATKKLVDALENSCRVHLIEVRPDEGDPADLSKEEVAQKLGNPLLSMLEYGNLVSEIKRLAQEKNKS